MVNNKNSHTQKHISDVEPVMFIQESALAEVDQASIAMKAFRERMEKTRQVAYTHIKPYMHTIYKYPYTHIRRWR
jgi:hypothetical protein